MSSQSPSTTINASPTTSNEKIKVAIRIRPPIGREKEFEEAISVPNNQTIVIQKSKQRSEMQFDRVFDTTTTQEQVFEEIRENIDSVLDGYNGTIFAYGQTGTGKTHTILGNIGQTGDVSREATLNNDDSPSSPRPYNIFDSDTDRSSHGIIPRAIRYILDYIQDNEETIRFRIYCSYLEIYNEKIFDLLKYDQKNSALAIREDKHGVYVQSLTTVLVRKEQDILKLLDTGASNRSIANNGINDRSSRSHTIFQLILEQEPLQGPDRTRCISKLNLVDLAGSERMDTWRNKSSIDQQRIQEMLNINQSLSNLGNCISALNESSRRHVPYRDSKLTRLLQDSLGGNCRTFFISTISPSILNFEESTSTLKFSDRANRVTLKASKNEVLDDAALVKRYEKEIARLQRLLHQNEWKARIQELEEDNQRLTAENARLLMLVGGNSATSSGESLDPSLKSKLTLVDQIEKDQKGREQELDSYHEWLHSIPVRNANGEYSIDLKDRLALLEQSVRMQQQELQRAKKLFLRDTKLMRSELEEKTTALEKTKELVDAQKLVIQKLKSNGALLQQQARSDDGKAVSSPDSGSHSELSDEDCGSNNTSSPIQATPARTKMPSQSSLLRSIENYEQIKENGSIHMEHSVAQFRHDLTLILQEHSSETLQIHGVTDEAIRKDVQEEVRELLHGCCEALVEALHTHHNSFSQSSHNIMRGLYEMVSSLTAHKNRELDGLHREYQSQIKKMRQNFVQKLRSSSCPSLLSSRKDMSAEQARKKNVRLQPNMLSLIKEALKEETYRSGASNDDTPLATWSRRTELRMASLHQFERQAYIRVGTLKNSLMRVLQKVKKFEVDVSSSSHIEFHRHSIESALVSLMSDMQRFEDTTFGGGTGGADSQITYTPSFAENKHFIAQPATDTPTISKFTRSLRQPPNIHVNSTAKHQSETKLRQDKSPKSAPSDHVSTSSCASEAASEVSLLTPRSDALASIENLFCVTPRGDDGGAHSSSLKQKLAEINQSMDELRSKFCT